ncbi:SEC-C metal-binding domain-containing protein [Candidatus Accumulibacter sp. ACC003]|uniref:SEC-C metal-binding domain-containing protein n=1 Tax=Candidatus Accumulibacter sp. ACC003 TaxID=2823334 RepID=UPI0025BE3AD0|nr:SEC-C metal-binding domain-containing protein [Candidatus Accumulibacter sp. ACC003]
MEHPCLVRAPALRDDVIMVEWALRYYADLPRHSPLRERIVAAWFDDTALAQWLAGDDLETIGLLLRYLPEQSFAHFTATIAELYGGWPSSLANAAARVLARCAPELAAQSFARILQSPERCVSEYALGILENLDQLPPTAALPLAEKLLPLAWRKDHQLAAVARPAAFAVALRLQQTPALPRLFDALCTARENRLDGEINAAATALFGHDAFTDVYFAQRSAYDNAAFFSDLAPLFEDDAPLAAMDEVLRATPALPQALRLLDDCHGRSPESAAAWTMIQESDAYQKQQLPEPLTALLLAAVACAFERKTLDTATMTIADSVDLLALEVSTNIHRQQLLAHLRRLPRQQVAAALSLQLTSSGDSWASVTLAKTMGELAWDEFTAPLLARLDDSNGDMLCEAASDSLKAIGEAARDALIEQWETLDHCQRIYGGSVLVAIGGQAVADFTLRHSEQLLHDDIARIGALTSTAPDPRLLELLRAELTLQQPAINKAYYCLARLLDATSPELSDLRVQIMQRRAKQQQSRARFDSAFGLLPAAPNSLELTLRCPACGRSGLYDVKGVVVGEASEPLMLADELACVACGEASELEFGPEAKMAIVAQTMLLEVASTGAARTTSTCLIVDKIESPDGRRETIPKAYARLQEKVQRDPLDWRSWFRLGKVLRHISRPRAALAALQQAHAQNPLALDAILILAEVLVDGGRQDEAFQLLNKARPDSGRWHIISTRPEQTRGDFAAFYRELQQQLGHEDPPAAAAPSVQHDASEAKVGRNDPCPCGSGKKFKKCCMP